MAARFRTRGHAPAVEVVQRAIESVRPPHALLLVGPPRVGKTTLALDLAAGLLCLAPEPAQRPCRECAACRKLDHGNHPDLHRLTPEGAGLQIRLGQVQRLTADLALLPVEGRFRFAILESAHRLNLDAQNALLKTLEEPQPAVVLVLAADESSTLLPTVASRCVRLRLGPVASAEVAALLEEAGVADAARGSRLARLAGGQAGLALTLAGHPEVLVVHERLVARLLALLGADRRARLAAVPELLDDAAALAAAAADAVTDPLAEETARRPRGASSQRVAPAERRAATVQLLGIWREVCRDLALAGRGGVAELRMHELTDELSARAGRIDEGQLTMFLSRLDGAARAVDAYANPELVLDALLLGWPREREAA